MKKILLEELETDLQAAGRWVIFLKGIDGKNPQLNKTLEIHYQQAVKLFEKKKTGLAQFYCSRILKTTEKEVNKILGPKCGICSCHEKTSGVKLNEDGVCSEGCSSLVRGGKSYS